MPERALSLSWRQAALRLEARLRELMGQAPERLDTQTIDSCYPRRHWVAAWRVGVTFSDKVVRRIDVVATAAFPLVPVRTALVDYPRFMTWPHVESDGVLCLLPNMAECDPDDPSAVAENLLGRSIRLIEELIEGTIIERDFREEFLTYWAYKAHADGAHLFSLLEPAPPSRVVKIWKGEGLEIVGENAENLADWVRRRFGANVETTTEEAAFVWLDQPPLPAAYPETASDLRALAVAVGNDAVSALDQAASGEPDYLVAILGATGRGGPGLIGVKAPNPKHLQIHPRSAAEPLSKGFSAGPHTASCAARPVFRRQPRHSELHPASRCELGAWAGSRSPNIAAVGCCRRAFRVRVGGRTDCLHSSPGWNRQDCVGRL